MAARSNQGFLGGDLFGAPEASASAARADRPTASAYADERTPPQPDGPIFQVLCEF